MNVRRKKQKRRWWSSFFEIFCWDFTRDWCSRLLVVTQFSVRRISCTHNRIEVKLELKWLKWRLFRHLLFVASFSPGMSCERIESRSIAERQKQTASPVVESIQRDVDGNRKFILSLNNNRFIFGCATRKEEEVTNNFIFLITGPLDESHFLSFVYTETLIFL